MIRAIFLAIFCLCLRSDLHAESLKVKVRAQSAILINLDTGDILYEKKAHKAHYPASTLKIATALFLLEEKKVPFERVYTATDRALHIMQADERQEDPMRYAPYVLEHDGVMMGLKVGEILSVDTLIHALLLQSSNDVANVLAENTSGSIEKFMHEMDDFLRKKGLRNTQFVNPHGLYHPAQMTTAYEMALMASWAFKNEVFARIIKTPSYSWYSKLTGIQETIHNTNRLIKEGKYHYPKALGGKTGYTESSGLNLVAAAADQGRRLVAVLFGCDSKRERDEDAIALFEAAFREKKVLRRLFSKDYPPFCLEVLHGKSELVARFNDDVTYAYFPSEESDLTAKLAWEKKKAPVKKEERVATVRIFNEKGRSVYEAPLYAASDVKLSYRSLYWAKTKARKGQVFLALALIFIVFAGLGVRKGLQRPQG